MSVSLKHTMEWIECYALSLSLCLSLSLSLSVSVCLSVSQDLPSLHPNNKQKHFMHDCVRIESESTKKIQLEFCIFGGPMTANQVKDTETGRVKCDDSYHSLSVPLTKRGRYLAKPF